MKSVLGVLCLSLVAGVALALMPAPAPQAETGASLGATGLEIMPFPAKGACNEIAQCEVLQICDCDVPQVLQGQACYDMDGRDYEVALCSGFYLCRTGPLASC